MPRKSWRDAIAAYSSPSTLVLLLLGFAAGLPYMLVFSTLSVWLREAGVARETIGFASLIGLAYAFKWNLADDFLAPLNLFFQRIAAWGLNLNHADHDARIWRRICHVADAVEGL
jgi:PAT family beta-lactamase induction signal transducer AmpG